MPFARCASAACFLLLAWGCVEPRELFRGFRRLACFLALGLLLIASCAHDEHLRNPGFQEALATELEQVARLKRTLVVEPFTVESVQRELGHIPRHECVELGHGMRWVVLTLEGGYTLTRIEMLAEAAEPIAIARMRIEQSFRKRRYSNGTVQSELERAWGEDTRQPWMPFFAERLDRAREAALLAPEAWEAPAEPPLELAEAFRILMDPNIQLKVGLHGGCFGGTPFGLQMTRVLVKAERFDLLRAVLRGPNPEARVYAAHALTEHGPLDEADAATIERLACLPMELRCYDLLFGRGSWDEALLALARP